jgi:hypothetical protein
VECLVGSDGVVDLGEPVDFDGEGVAVVDGSAVEVLVLEGAEEPLDDAVGLRALDSGADVAQQNSGKPCSSTTSGPVPASTQCRRSPPTSIHRWAMPLALPIQVIPSLLSRATPDHSGQPSTAPFSTASFNCRSRLTRKYPHPLTLVIAVRTLASDLLSSPNHFPRRAMHHGCVCSRQRRRGGSGGGGGRHRQALGGSRGVLHP